MNLQDNDSGQPSLTSSRRAFLRGASALGLAVAAFPAVAELSAPAAGAAPAAQFLGSNQGPFKEIRSGETVKGKKYPGVPGLSGVRIYGLKPTGKNHETNHIARHWPQPTPPPEPAHPGPIVYSIYPVPADVMSGQLYDALTSLIKQAPAGSYLTCWHEALSLKYPKYITSEAMYQLHARMNTITKKANPGVTYGAVFGGGDLATLLRSAPPNLGFYGLDLYGNEGISSGLARLETFITLARKKDTITPGYPRLMLPECNTPIDSQRPDWFKEVCTRMKKYGANSAGVLTFWNGPGTIGANWDPTDTKTIAAMNDVVEHIF
jgi:hypothetical protein